MNEDKTLITLLTINLSPEFLKIAQYEVIKYQFNVKRMKLAIKYIRTALR